MWPLIWDNSSFRKRLHSICWIILLCASSTGSKASHVHKQSFLQLTNVRPSTSKNFRLHEICTLCSTFANVAVTNGALCNLAISHTSMWFTINQGASRVCVINSVKSLACTALTIKLVTNTNSAYVILIRNSSVQMLHT